MGKIADYGTNGHRMFFNQDKGNSKKPNLIEKVSQRSSEGGSWVYSRRRGFVPQGMLTRWLRLKPF